MKANVRTSRSHLRLASLAALATLVAAPVAAGSHRRNNGSHATELTMKRTFLAAVAIATLAAADASRAAIVPAEAIKDLRIASQQLEEAALLRNVASDKTEAQHLLAARDLLRTAEPQLDWTQRLQATMLEHEIGRDILFADEADTLTLPLPMQPITEARVARDDLGELAKRGAELANQTAVASGQTPAAGS